MRKYIMYCMVLGLAVLSACTEDIVVQEPEFPSMEKRIPLYLHVGNVIELTTRGTSLGLQDGSLSVDSEVGLFIMRESDFDSLKTGIVHYDRSYGYENLRCRVGSNGGIMPTDTAELFYPLEQDAKIVVFAYAPYDSAMTRERLLLPGDTVSVDRDQSRDDLILKNDFILGVPVYGNPLVKAGVNGYPVDSRTESVALSLKHQRCRLALEVTLHGKKELLGDEDLLYADSILVYAENVPVTAPLGYSLDSQSANYDIADGIECDTVLMAVYKDIAIDKNQEYVLTSTAIVLPSDEMFEPSFRVEIVSGGQRQSVRRRVSNEMSFKGGTSVSFEMIIGESQNENLDYSVDLGLPSGTLWADRNVGADSPEAYGDYFAWGETAPKSYYHWSTYKWCMGSYDDTMTKYCPDSNYGTVDNKTVLDLEDDAAYVNMGPEWRMPTADEQSELRKECTWIWTTQNGTLGYKVTGPNGKSIFLPAAGYRGGYSLYFAGYSGYYWSASLYESNPNYAWYLFFDYSYHSTYSSYRYFGHTVRAVAR